MNPAGYFLASGADGCDKVKSQEECEAAGKALGFPSNPDSFIHPRDTRTFKDFASGCICGKLEWVKSHSTHKIGCAFNDQATRHPCGTGGRPCACKSYALCKILDAFHSDESPIAINSPSLLADANPKGYFIEKRKHSCSGSEIKQLAECIAAAKSLNLPANAVEEIKDSKYAITKPGTGCRCTTDEKGTGAIQLVNGRWVSGKSLMKCFFNPYKTGRDCGYDKYNCICRNGW